MMARIKDGGAFCFGPKRIFWMGWFWSVLLLTTTECTRAEDFQFVSYPDPNAIRIMGYTGLGDIVNIPSTINGLTVTSIAGGAFQNCTNITSVTIPDCVLGIGGPCVGVFKSCTSLTNVTIGDGVTYIGIEAFSGCTMLTRVVIGKSVNSIAFGAFSNCTSLSSITIPASVTSIGYGAFNQCTNLASIYFKGIPPAVYPSAFAGDSNVTVYYLSGATNWGSTFCGQPTALWNH